MYEGDRQIGSGNRYQLSSGGSANGSDIEVFGVHGGFTLGILRTVVIKRNLDILIAL